MDVLAHDAYTLQVEDESNQMDEVDKMFATFDVMDDDKFDPLGFVVASLHVSIYQNNNDTLR